ncbi:MAG: MBL fold metallo-hydrolase [Candidatus Methanoplasma sp.]|jgi:glyoxylase-like metal-dependent hydrolase (beta-lactamase superfamily II)|nr:MBL fold metallo-hydrolase [Candidatus Methanoplasma sp.]
MVICQINADPSFDSNIYLIIGGRTALIDTGTGGANPENIAGIKKILKGKNLDMIILTHFHYDHTGGLSGMLKEFDSEVSAGAGDAPYIMGGDPIYTMSGMFGGEHEPVDVIGLTEDDIVDLGDHRLRVINTPGHTCGGICLYDEITHSLFSGDTVFSRGVGRTDFPTGSAKELTESLRKLSGIDVKMLYPGHSDISSDGNEAVRYGLLMMGGL